MRRNLLAAGAAVLTLGSAPAIAGSAQVSFDNFQVSVYDSTGAVNPASTVTFIGGDSADSEITQVPPKYFPGPPGWTGYASGPVSEPGAFDEIYASGQIDFPYFSSTAIFTGLSRPDPGGYVYASGGDYYDGPFNMMASETLGGTSFLLAPHSELVVSTSVSMSATDGGYAGASLSFAGLQGSSWNDGVADGGISHDVRLVFLNATDATVTGKFSATFTASSVPEPITGLLWLTGLVGLALARTVQNERWSSKRVAVGA